ncbi:MAG: aminotransferase class V-fold PLP-dependent enzyme, partial [Actinomycetota bacterium]
LHDVGSGLLDRYREVPPEEPAATEALAEGADLVCFSGDKLLGGPQAGILLGRSELIDRLRRHPVARAVRVDKMTVAALEAVLRLYAEGHRDQVPAWRLLRERPAALRSRARVLAGSLPAASVETGEAVAGGGSIPGYGIPSVMVRLPAKRPTDLAARLRVGNPAVICRVDADSLVFDLRTVFPQEDERLARAVRYALSQGD